MNAVVFPENISHQRGDLPPDLSIHDERTLALYLYPDCDEVLKGLGLSDREIRSIRGEFYAEGLHAVLISLMMAEYAGLDPSEGHDLRRIVEKVHPTYDVMNLMELLVEEDNFTATLTCPKRSGFRGATLQDRDSTLTYTGDVRHHKSRVFSIHLPEEKRAQIYENLSPGTVDYTPGAFAFLRYIPNEVGSIQVIEVRSDIYDRITDPTLKKKYQGWMTELLSSFDAFMNSQYGTLAFTQGPNKILNEALHPLRDGVLVTVPSAASLYRKWEDQYVQWKSVHGKELFIKGEKFQYIQGIPSENFRRLHRIISKLEFRPSRLPERFDEPTVEKKVLTSRKSQMKVYRTSDQTPELELPFVRIRNTRLQEIHAEFKRRFPEEVFQEPALALGVRMYSDVPRAPAFEGAIARARISEAFEFAPSREIPSSRMRDVSSEDVAVRDDILSRQALEWIPKAIKGFTPISKGQSHGISDAWWEVPKDLIPGWNIQPLHIEAQKRHPVIRLIEADDKGALTQMFSVGFKGAGLWKLEKEYVESKAGEGVRLPIYYRTEDPSMPRDIVYSTHVLWGGMSRNFARQEFSTNLELLRLVEEADPTLSKLVPIPLDVHQYEALPVWNEEDEASWVSTANYIKDCLGLKYEETTIPCLFRSITPSDVRLVQVATRIFGRTPDSISNVLDAKNEIDSALRIFYLANGEHYIAPYSAPTAGENGITEAEVLNYLAEAFALNERAAKRIFEKFETNTVRLLGVVHGAGGDLGGGSEDGVGIPNGGGVAIRNIGLCGDVHDFDGGILAPWGNRATFGGDYRQKYQSARKRMQAFDAIYLEESLHWAYLILFGSAEFEGFESPQSRIVSLAPNHDITYLHGSSETTVEMLQATVSFMVVKPADEVLAPRRRELYKSALELGRSARKRLEAM